MNNDQDRASLNLRVAPALKARIKDYAATMGLSVNAAATVLLDRGLRATGQDTHTPKD